VLLEAGTADANGLVVIAGAPVFFRELRKNNRRRILTEPASKFFQARISVRHRGELYCVRYSGKATVTVSVVRPVRPPLSVTTR
jgi:hypothetical protein